MKAPDSGAGARFLLIAACVVVVIAGLREASSLILPFLIAVFIAMISLPLLHWLHARGLPAPVAVLLTIVADLCAIVAMGALIGSSIAEFTDEVPKYQARLQRMTVEGQQWLAERGVDVSTEYVLGQLDPGGLLNVFTGALRGVANVLSNLVLVVLAIVFILAEAAGFPEKLAAALGADVVSGRFGAMRSEIQRYLGIKTLVSLVTGAVVAAAMAIIGVDFPLLWGMLAFFLNYVPALGSIIASIPPILLAIVQPDIGVGGVIGVAAVFLAVNMFLGNVVEPYMMGRGLGLSTLVVFVSLVFWGWVWGPVGMLVSVPMTMIVKIMLENTEDLRWVAVLLGPPPRAIMLPTRRPAPQGESASPPAADVAP